MKSLQLELEGLVTGSVYNNGCPPLCLRLHDRKQQSSIRTQILPYLEDRVLIAHPSFHKQHASCSWNTCTAACYGPGMQGMGSRCWAKSLNGPKLTIMYCASLPLEVASLTVDSKVLKIATPDRFYLYNCCLGGGDRFLMLCILPPIQNSPSNKSLFILSYCSI